MRFQRAKYVARKSYGASRTVPESLALGPRIDHYRVPLDGLYLCLSSSALQKLLRRFSKAL